MTRDDDTGPQPTEIFGEEKRLQLVVVPNNYRSFPEVRPWALILGGRLYGANIWVEYRYYLYLSPYTVRPTLYWVWILFVVATLYQWSANFFIAAQITFSIAIEGPLHLKPLEQNETDTGNMQLPYNSPGGYLIHVLFSQFVFFQLTAQGGLLETPVTKLLVVSKCFSKFRGWNCLVVPLVAGLRRYITHNLANFVYLLVLKAFSYVENVWLLCIIWLVIWFSFN